MPPVTISIMPVYSTLPSGRETVDVDRFVARIGFYDFNGGFPGL